MPLRPYQPADFPALYAIEELCFQPPIRYSRAYLQRLMASSNSATWVAEVDSELAGFTVVEWYQEAPGERVAYIQTIEVASQFRRRGIASELLRQAEISAHAAGAKLIWLHVESNNHSAIRLYQSHGFTHRGHQGHYYARNRSAEIYLKPLGA